MESAERQANMNLSGGAPTPDPVCLDALAQVNTLFIRSWRTVTAEQGKTWDVVAPLYCAVQDSLSSLLLLSRHGCVRDSYAIARCILETSLNASFILAEGDPIAERAYRHYMQKSLREMSNDVRFLNEYLGHEIEIPDWHSSDTFSELLGEFTKKSGHEASWAQASYEGRLKSIGHAFGVKAEKMLRVSMHSIYRPASEILHGTFYGAMFGAGQAKIPESFTDHEQFIAWLSQQLSLVDVMSGSAAAVLLTAIGGVTGSTSAGNAAVRAVQIGARGLSSAEEDRSQD